MRVRHGRLIAGLLVGSLLLAACGSDDDEPAAGDAAATTTAAPAAEPEPEPDPEPIGYEQVVPGGDCACSDGSEYSFWVREADPERVVLFFQGGGACFDAASCDPAGGTYKTTTGAADDPSGLGGLLDLADERNPVADFSVVYVPYCTGDVHLGHQVHEYGPGLSINHLGGVNAEAAVEHLLATFPDATQVLVTGESAGSIPSPLYAGLVADGLPDADITVLADGSGAYPDIPVINATIGSVWGSLGSVPDWPEAADATAETWSLPGLFIRAGEHAPQITFARHDFAFDETQVFFSELAGIPGDRLVEAIDATEAQIEAAGVDLLSFISPGDDHTILTQDRFYDHEAEGVALLDWVVALLAGDPVEDVHCTACE